MSDLYALVACGILLVAAEVLAARDRNAAAAAVTIVATWVMALAITWVSPFLAPVGLLALLLPLVIVADHLGPRTRTATIVATVTLCGLLSGMGVARWPAYEPAHPVTTRTVLIVAIFVPVLVSVLVAGLRDYVTRLSERTRELEESRARLAVAAIEARRSIERDLHDGAQQRLATIAVDLGRATRMFDQDPPQARTHRAAACRASSRRRSASCATWRTASTRRCSASAGWSAPCPPRPAAPSCRAPSTCTRWAGTRPRWRRRSTSAAPRPSRTPTGTREARSSSCRRPTTRGPAAGCGSASPTTGSGFDPAAVRSAHGLTGMRDRIRAAGGELRIISAPGRGTTVEGQLRARHAASRADRITFGTNGFTRLGPADISDRRRRLQTMPLVVVPAPPRVRMGAPPRLSDRSGTVDP